MTCVLDGAVFRDRKNRRCIALNSGHEHCLVVGEDASQTFTLRAGDTNSALASDTGQAKVRSMATPNDRGATGSGFLPAGRPIFFESRVQIGGNFQRMTAWWFVLAQFQRITNPGPPPVSLLIDVVNGMEYFRASICHPGAIGGQKLDTPRVPVPRATPSGPSPFRIRFDYLDAAGGPDGFLKIVVTVDGKAPQTICNYRGVTGFPNNAGLYPGWGIYGADRASPTRPVVWSAKQLPLVIQFDQIDWGTAQ